MAKKYEYGDRYKDRYKPCTHYNLEKLKIEYPRMGKTIEKNFARHVGEPDKNGCRNWTAAVGRDGYGNFGFFYKQSNAHRVAWILAHGDIGENELIQQTCGNRRCVEITHLVSGSSISDSRVSDYAKYKEEITPLLPPIIEGYGRRLDETLRKRLCEIYLATELRQEDVADIFGVSAPTVQNILLKGGISIAPRKRAAGEPMPLGYEPPPREPKKPDPPSPEFISRFMEKVQINPNAATNGVGTDCLDWIGSRSEAGYGQVTWGIVGPKLAHRTSWIIHNGEIPDDLYVCHKCDRPPCVNPDHLFLGTASDNTKDMYAKGRRDKFTKGGWKLSLEKKVELYRRVLADDDPDIIAADFDITRVYVFAIARKFRNGELKIPENFPDNSHRD